MDINELSRENLIKLIEILIREIKDLKDDMRRVKYKLKII